MKVDRECCEIVNRAKENGQKILAVGTTVQRALEVCVGPDCRIKEFEGWTNKFIFPPYEFSVADSMLVNFHLPYSTLLMLTTAFGGYENTMKAYEVALQEDYRFGVYGDCPLIVD
jgi:S-adenosylmethionine:tRNA ribosyltransferase-isomerase